MDEENKENNFDKNAHKTSCHLIKFGLILISIFLATYLAVYYVLDQIKYAYYLPSVPIEDIDKIIREQDKFFNKQVALPMHEVTNKAVNSPVETFKDKDSNSYKMIINLKEFDNNPQNVSIKIKDNTIEIKGINDKTEKNSEKIYAFSQTYTLPDNIDEDKVTKEHVKNNYIITMPIETDND